MAVAALRFLLLGEQATGKSSLLVALYGALVNRRAGELRIVRTIDDVEFLSRGLESFGRHQSLSRTEVDTRARLAMELSRDGETVGVELPDRSGELLRHMIDQRVWDPELRRQVREAAGAMLFLRADQLLGERGVDGSGAFGPWPDPHDEAPPAGPDGREPDPWSPSLMPVDVRAVDLLQTLLEERETTLPVAVVVSAWDRVWARAVWPGSWLAEQAPLLSQFLASHAAQLPHAVFGVSAQGGDFDGGAPLVMDAEDPWDRAYVIGPDGLRATFAEPIAWLIDAAR